MDSKPKAPRTASPYDLNATTKNRPSGGGKPTSTREQSPYTLSRETSLRAGTNGPKKS
jgi:hypothetical protein